eukprot:993660-Pyramimonas_sp.AAC.1
MKSRSRRGRRRRREAAGGTRPRRPRSSSRLGRVTRLMTGRAEMKHRHDTVEISSLEAKQAVRVELRR